MPLPKSNLGLLAAAGAATLWAIAGVFGKILLSGTFSPGQLVFYRCALGSVLLLILLLAWKKSLLKIARRDLPFLIMLGVFGLAFTQFAYYGAIQSMSVGLAILLQYLAPLWILLYERLWQKKPLTLTKIRALVLALLGCLLVSIQTGDSASVNNYGLSLGIASGVCFAAYGLMSQKALKLYPEITILFYSLLFTAIFWSVAASEVWIPLIKLEVTRAWMIFYVAVFGTVAPFLLFIFALKHLEAAQVGIISTLEPVIAAAIAWIYLGENLTGFQILGGFLVLSAIVVLQVRKTKRLHT